jgi:putative heme-binding domain-containing protein
VALRTIANGWTPELRRQYLGWWPIKRDPSQHPEFVKQWFEDAGRAYSDGASFNNFLIKMRRTAVSNATQSEMASLQPVLDSWIEPLPKVKTSKKQRSYVQDWKVADLEGDLDKVGHGRNFANGQDALYAVQCLLCHRMGEEGGSVGPELTAIASRFSRHDILESIIEPSKVISEQYANTDITLKNGETMSGRVVSENDEKIVVRPSLLTAEMKEFKKADIKSREVSKISPMPPGLLNMLTKEEILDLLAYFEAGGKGDGAPFKK